MSPSVRVAVLGGLFFWQSVSHAQIYRCVIDGRTHLQDKPCPTNPSERAATPAARPVNRPPIGDPAYEKAREAQRLEDVRRFSEEAGKRGVEANELKRAELERRGCGDRGDGPPYIGAPAHWVRTCSSWGSPSRVTSTTSTLGTSEVWWYRDGGTVFFDANQTVRLIQKTGP